MENQLFTLKFTAKQLQRQALKAEKAEKQEKLKLKKAIEQGNLDGARIYAQNAIRQKNQALNYLRLGSRIDAVASRVDSAIKMKTVTRSMANIVKAMEVSMKTMNLEKITAVMDQFEKQFEDLDVQSEYVESTMNQTTSLTTPQEQVDTLIQQVADEHGLEVAGKLDVTPSLAAPVAAHAHANKAHEEEDELTARLNQLKSK